MQLFGLEGQPRAHELENENSKNVEGGSGHSEDPHGLSRKKRYYRHTSRQMQELDKLLKECPHPDDKQCQGLSKELGLEPRQVKLWFHGMRAYLKAEQARLEKSILRSDNEKLRGENITIREALKNASCRRCGGPITLGELASDEQQLHIENARLKEELDRVYALVAKYLGRPIQPLSLLLVSNSSLDVQVGRSSLEHAGMIQGVGDLVHGPSVADFATRLGDFSEAEKPVVSKLSHALREMHVD